MGKGTKGDHFTRFAEKCGGIRTFACLAPTRGIRQLVGKRACLACNLDRMYNPNLGYINISVLCKMLTITCPPLHNLTF